MVSRRSLLGLLPGTLLAGCVDGSLGAEESSDDSNVNQTVVRGEHDDRISVRDVESETDVEYLEDDHAVRYVAAITSTGPESGDGPPETEREYETVPFEEWARSECVSLAAEAAAETTNERLESDDVDASSSSSIEEDARVALLKIETVRNGDGEVVSEPDVEFEDFVAATPEAVEATYVLEDADYSATVPVYATHEQLKQQ